MKLTLKTTLALAVLIAGSFSAPASVIAPDVTPSSTTTTYVPNPVDLNDLDHHVVYTWRIDNITLNAANITGATLTFANIANWDSNPNVLHLHLLDTAKNAGVASFVDDTTGAVPVVDFTDDFKSPRYHGQSNWLVANGTADRFLTDKSFTINPTNYTYTFTAQDLQALQSYILNGRDLALGFDPDCHFFNDGVSFSITTVTPVPEVSAFLPIIGLLAAVGGLEIRRRKKATA